MILVDTSVWIEYFRHNEPYFSEVSAQLEGLQVYTTDFIFGELLQGAKDLRERRLILSLWDYLPKARVADIGIKAGEFSSVHKLSQKGIGLIDSAIIVAAKECSCRVWTLDTKLSRFLKSGN